MQQTGRKQAHTKGLTVVLEGLEGILLGDNGQFFGKLLVQAIEDVNEAVAESVQHLYDESERKR